MEISVSHFMNPVFPSRNPNNLADLGTGPLLLEGRGGYKTVGGGGGASDVLPLQGGG